MSLLPELGWSELAGFGWVGVPESISPLFYVLMRDSCFYIGYETTLHAGDTTESLLSINLCLLCPW
ncbi:MAG: hypothetical protein ABRQ39_27060 [Candidatus Eremiobacterota bacterium]